MVLDGADCNRQFIKLHFEEDPAASNFATRNLHTGDPMVFIMDCKVKCYSSLANNLHKSINLSNWVSPL